MSESASARCAPSVLANWVRRVGEVHRQHDERFLPADGCIARFQFEVFVRRSGVSSERHRCDLASTEARRGLSSAVSSRRRVPTSVHHTNAQSYYLMVAECTRLERDKGGRCLYSHWIPKGVRRVVPYISRVETMHIQYWARNLTAKTPFKAEKFYDVFSKKCRQRCTTSA